MPNNPATVRDLRVGERGVLAEPTLPDHRRRRLAELGLRAGETVTLVQRAVGGARILAVGESRIALDARLSAQLPLIGESA